MPSADAANASPDSRDSTTAPIGILLANVGTPASPTPKDVRPYLAQFLRDRRIIDLPKWLWYPILYCIILVTRPKRSAKLYENVWTNEGSPLLVTLKQQAASVQALLDVRFNVPVRVEIGMGYGSPSIADGLQALQAAGVQRILILPLYPQYSTTTTAAAFDDVFAEVGKWRWMPELRTVHGYHDNEGYLDALEETIRQQWRAEGRSERLLLSYHGIPKMYSDRGEPYFQQCHHTSHLLAGRLGLSDDEWAVSFQSRFGPIEWLKPYTDKLLEEWGESGVQSVDAICPGFSADCLETIDEIGREAAESFTEAGGQDFHYIPALNVRADHLEMLAGIVERNIQGWTDT